MIYNNNETNIHRKESLKIQLKYIAILSIHDKYSFTNITVNTTNNKTICVTNYVLL